MTLYPLSAAPARPKPPVRMMVPRGGWRRLVISVREHLHSNRLMISTEARSFPASYAHTRRLSSHADEINRSLVRASGQTIGINEKLGTDPYLLRLITTQLAYRSTDNEIVSRDRYCEVFKSLEKLD